MIKNIQKLLVANRSEIAIRILRAATELRLETVAIYSHEDRFALHRFKADEAYLVGKPGEPIRSYLDIDAIIEIAVAHNVDAIHPGYGFLSENPDLARACEKAGIVFVGPSINALEELGDKTAARKIADRVKVPILSGSNEAIVDGPSGLKQAEALGFPIILKAAKGGGGRGMRVVHAADKFVSEFESAQRESLVAFGSPDIFIEKFIAQARHIEVQIMGDKHGNLVHLFERDCSVQRRHQKVVEIAPAPNLDPAVRKGLCDSAIEIGKAVSYSNAGTVEFLVDAQTNKFYFIEVNPRVQVEHTVTEEVTGVDIVKTQILIASGLPLHDPQIDLGDQSKISTHGFALQCRVTTEDAEQDFRPDYGRITHYRSAAGMGIRLDAGSAFTGAVVTPFYDSLLVKVSARARRFKDAIRKMERTLMEFRVRGVKTNIQFLLRLLAHPTFQDGLCTTRFIDQTKELFDFPTRKDRASKILKYIGEVIVNGNKTVKGMPVATRRSPAPIPVSHHMGELPFGTRSRLLRDGREKFVQWIRDEKPLLVTDTTCRDAHQSILATRLRTHDLLNIAHAYATRCPQLFSLEMWGGATFDTSMRFLRESPWDRLTQMRAKAPNILFQMLLRASNAVGYANYPDNIVQEFVKESADAGIDVFRVFDALNWVPNMRVAMDAVLNTSHGLCEAAICYTGDILNPARTKYNLKYYVELAKELEKGGAHILAIKDMAGLCKPDAAELLVKTLKQEIGIPIHFHTHDTAGTQAAAILNASRVGLDIADMAMAPLSGGTSQPNLNTIVESLRFSDRNTGLDTEALDQIAFYWQAVREFYKPFDGDLLPATSDLYVHEMPGGQYTNLYQQAKAVGLSDRWHEVCQTYAEVNQMVGDIVKVTPTSKAVGDMALFMVANNLTQKEVLDENRQLSFPASVIDLVGGMMGQPPGGFPEAVKRRVLHNKPDMTQRPGELLPPADFTAAKDKLTPLMTEPVTHRDVLSYLLYDKVFEDYVQFQEQFSDISMLPTPVYFYGLQAGEELSIDIEEGKTLIIKFLTISDPHPDGTRTVFFELNGQPRDVTIQDMSLEASTVKIPKAEPGQPGQVGASMPGMVVKVDVKLGDVVIKGQKLVTLEAMKMTSTIHAEREGNVTKVHVAPGQQVETGDLLIVIE
jgi:pyruvate carboxylase